MGVKTLSSFALNHSTTKELSFSYLKDNTIAVDVSVFLYEWLKDAQKRRLEDELELKHDTQLKDIPEHHWEWYCVKTLDTLRKYRIKLIFLFEKTHPEEKNATVNHRKQRKQIIKQYQERIKDVAFKFKAIMNDLENEDEKPKYQINKTKNIVWNKMKELLMMYTHNSIKATSTIYKTLRNIISAAGVRWIECEGEAEYIGVDLVKTGIVDYIMSNDSDCIACLCDKYVTNFNWDKETFSFIHVKQLIRSLNITPEQFQIACCCIGNDYQSCVLSDKVYWNSIKHELKRLKLFKKNDMMNKFPQNKDTLQFCWNLYNRTQMKSKMDLQGIIQGDACVAPRILSKIRETGLCV